MYALLMLSGNARSFLYSTVVVWLFGMSACMEGPHRFVLDKADDPASPPDAGIPDGDLFMDGFPPHVPTKGCGDMPPFPPTLPKPGDAWRQFGHDATHANRSSATVGSAPQVLWKAEIHESAYALNPVVDENGNLYATTDEQLYAFTPNGELRWRTGDTPPGYTGVGFRGVAIQQDGSVVTSLIDGVVRGYSATGAELFVTTLPSPTPKLTTPPTLDSNGTIYVGGTEANGLSWTPSVYALRSNGEVAWSTVLEGKALEVSAIAIDATNSLYVSLGFKDAFTAAFEGRVVKLNDKGEVLWSISNKSYARAPAITSAGDIWVAVDEDNKIDPVPYLYRYSSEGIPLAFVVNLRFVSQGPPAVDLAGNAYLGMAGGLAAFNPAGEESWRIWANPYPDPAFRIWSHSAVDAEGTVVISDSVGAIRGVRNGCVIFSINRDGPSPTTMNDSVVIGADGTIYAGSPSKYVYAFR